MTRGSEGVEKQKESAPIVSMQERIEAMEHSPTLQEVMAHFGYETIGEWSSIWLNKPGQIERLSELPEFIKTLGLDRGYRIIFDYDPAYPKMLLQATVSGSNR